MEDKNIVDLLFAREEQGILELSSKYQSYCYKIAWNILSSEEDSKECVNDTWMSVWSCIPPKRPEILSAFLGKITRGHAIDRLRKRYAAKRADSHLVSIEQETKALDLLISKSLEDELAEKEVVKVINRFLDSLKEADRDIFLRRYWYLDSEKEIASRHGKTVNSVKSNLYRSRKKLLKMMEKDGICHG